jgi:hypothetical protein
MLIFTYFRYAASTLIFTFSFRCITAAEAAFQPPELSAISPFSAFAAMR